MSNETTKTNVTDSNVKVNTDSSKPVFIERNVSSQTVAADIASRVTGKLIGFDDLFDPKTKTFLTEKELKAKGAVFVTVKLDKVLGKSDCVVKGRTTKNPTPFIRKTSSYQVIANINWASFVNKRGHGNFIPAENRSNGVENYCECKAVGKTRADNFTINGVAFRVLESTTLLDSDGKAYDNQEFITTEYLKKQSAASKQKEADKHGIEVRFDPKYRTTRIDSCKSIRCFGFEYKPTDNHRNS